MSSLSWDWALAVGASNCWFRVLAWFVESFYLGSAEGAVVGCFGVHHVRDRCAFEVFGFFDEVFS